VCIRPCSGGTLESSVSRGPGSRGALRVRMAERAERKSESPLADASNQSSFLLGLAPRRHQPNRRVLHLADLAETGLGGRCEPGRGEM